MRVSSLHPFGSAPVSGVLAKVVLMNPKHVYTELAHQAFNHRKVLCGREDSGSQRSWLPYYKRLPKPMWTAVVSVDVLPNTRLARKTTVSQGVPA